MAWCLGYKDTADALKKRVDAEDKLTRRFGGVAKCDTLGGKAVMVHVDEEDKLYSQNGNAGQAREMTLINESGLYSLIMSSKLPTAKVFKRWVTSDVLPAIRTLCYSDYLLFGKQGM